MSETKPGGIDLGENTTRDQQALEDFDAKLASPPAGGSEIALSDATEIALFDDDVAFPEVVVGRLFEMAQHPERYTEEELSASIDRTELLLKKLELRAKLASPESLSAIIWIMSVFIPKLREQISDYFRRKQQSKEAAAQYKAISETVDPLIQKLRTFLDQMPKPREFGSAGEKMERILSLKERCRQLEEAHERLQALLADPVFKNPILVVQTNYTESRTKNIALPNSRLSHPFNTTNGQYSEMFGKTANWIKDINQNLQLADLQITPESMRQGKFYFNADWFNTKPSLNYYDSKSGSVLFVYYDISDLTLRIAVSAAKLKERLDTSKRELDELEGPTEVRGVTQPQPEVVEVEEI